MAIHSFVKDKSVRQQVSKEEWGKRVDLAAAYRLMDLYGMTELSANHISTRVPGEDRAFLINPYGMLYDQMHASCFIKLDLDGNIRPGPDRGALVQRRVANAARQRCERVLSTLSADHAPALRRARVAGAAAQDRSVVPRLDRPLGVTVFMLTGS